MSDMQMSKLTGGVNVILLIAILFVINLIAQQWYLQLDLTQDRRFSLTDATENLVDGLDDQLLIKVLLDGPLPEGFERLKNETENLLRKLNGINPNLIYEFDSPTAEGTIAEKNEIIAELAKDGLVPIQLSVVSEDEMTKRRIYPYAIVSKGTKKIIVNILEEQTPGASQEIVLNNSIGLLEYKIADAIQKLLLERKPNIIFTDGHGEFDKTKTIALERLLGKYYNVDRVNIDSVVTIPKTVDLLMVIAPKETFDSKALFKLDQYIMNGGKVIWLVDYLNANLDSINQNGFFVPTTYETGLEDLWFQYGFRIQPDLVLDLECTRIPQVIGQSGGKPQLDLFKWPYHPLVATNALHPISKNLDRINVFFPSTIDTIKTLSTVSKTALLRSSPYTRYQLTPVRLNFEILKYDLDASKFDKAPRDLALLLEGTFDSAFKNRMTQSTLDMLDQIGESYVEQSPPTKQLVVSDAAFIKNLYNPETEQYSQIGYNRWEQRVFPGNEDFIINSVEYMLDSKGVLSARSKEIKLRLLDTIKAREEGFKYQVINVVLPLIALALFGWLFAWWRRRRFAR